jgi:hypothetical protein
MPSESELLDPAFALANYTKGAVHRDIHTHT